MRRPLLYRLSPFFFAAVVSTAACGADAPDPLDLFPPTAILTIDNQSHFPLEEVRAHAELDYRASANLLGQPLAHDSSINLEIANRLYITIVRRRIDAGVRVAFTTAWPLELEQDGYTLIVFQESFRLVEPLPPLTDGGPTDDGAPPGDAPSGDTGQGDAPSGDTGPGDGAGGDA